MDLLRDVLNETKKKVDSRKRLWQKEDSSSEDSDDDAPRNARKPRKKYLRRGEIAMLEAPQEDRKKIVEPLLLESPRKAPESTKQEEKEKTLTPRSHNKQTEAESISATEVKLRLRKYGQPITLFGETATDRLERLKEYEVKAHSMETGSSAGMRNAFQDIMNEEVEAEILQATAAAIEDDDDEEKKTRLEAARIKAKRRNEKYARPRPRKSFKHREDYIAFFFKRLLREWELQLDARPDAQKRTIQGKTASATQKQTRNNLKPLLKQLSAKTAPDDILKHTERIVNECHKREYVKANEAYLMLAIGNAAWPMGVTMVGIHERAGREKIFSQQVAHVLNDETQRKYVQSIKRLMTFCQSKWPNVPSKNVA